MKIASGSGRITIELTGLEAARLTNILWPFCDTRTPGETVERRFALRLARVIDEIQQEKARGVYREMQGVPR